MNMSSRNQLPDASGLVVAAQDNNYPGRLDTTNMASDHPDSARESDQTDVDSPREYEYPGDEEDGRYEEPHRSAGFWDPRMNKIRKEVVTSWARTR